MFCYKLLLHILYILSCVSNRGYQQRGTEQQKNPPYFFRTFSYIWFMHVALIARNIAMPTTVPFVAMTNHALVNMN